MLCASLRSFEEDGIKNATVLNRDLEKMTGQEGWLARLLFYTKDPAKTMTDLSRKIETTKARRMWRENTDHMLRNQEGEPTLLSYRDAAKTPMLQEVKELIGRHPKARNGLL